MQEGVEVAEADIDFNHILIPVGIVLNSISPKPVADAPEGLNSRCSSGTCFCWVNTEAPKLMGYWRFSGRWSVGNISLPST